MENQVREPMTEPENDQNLTDFGNHLKDLEKIRDRLLQSLGDSSKIVDGKSNLRTLAFDIIPVISEFFRVQEWYIYDLHSRLTLLENNADENEVDIVSETIGPDLAIQLIEFIGQAVQIFGIVINNDQMKKNLDLVAQITQLTLQAGPLINYVQEITGEELSADEDEDNSPEAPVLEPAGQSEQSAQGDPASEKNFPIQVEETSRPEPSEQAEAATEPPEQAEAATEPPVQAEAATEPETPLEAMVEPTIKSEPQAEPAPALSSLSPEKEMAQRQISFATQILVSIPPRVIDEKEFTDVLTYVKEKTQFDNPKLVEETMEKLFDSNKLFRKEMAINGGSKKWFYSTSPIE